MEDRAKFVLIGLFTFAVIVGAFGFVFWLHNAAGEQESATYRVIFNGSVTGLKSGAPVLFNGIRVGEVTALRLTDNPAQVAVVMAVAKTTPIRKDTRVTLNFAGLTGIASISLEGVLASAPPLVSKNGEPPTLMANADASKGLSESVRNSLNKVNSLIDENQENLHKAIANLENFTEALKRNGDRIDKLMKSSSDAMDSFHTLGDNLNKRTAVITRDVHEVSKTANEQIKNVGTEATRAMQHIDKAVVDLANHPQRFLFGGPSTNKK